MKVTKENLVDVLEALRVHKPNYNAQYKIKNAGINSGGQSGWYVSGLKYDPNSGQLNSWASEVCAPTLIEAVQKSLDDLSESFEAPIKRAQDQVDQHRRKRDFIFSTFGANPKTDPDDDGDDDVEATTEMISKIN